MKFYRIDRFGSLDGIVMHNGDMPTPGAKEVVIKVHATSLNKRDHFILHQFYALPPKLGIIPISDGAGEVVQVGEEVTKWKIGDRVMGNYFAKWRDGKVHPEIGDQLGCTLNGMLTEYGIFHEDWLVRVPDQLTWAEAATLPCAALTAWSSLTGSEKLFPGNWVLTIGTGGVSLFVIQLARLMGLRVIALTTKEKKIEPLKLLGAEHVINYKETPEWHLLVKEITNGRGIQRVVETGGFKTFEQSVKAANFGGEVVLLNSIPPKETVDTGIASLLRHAFIGLVTIRPLFVGSRIALEALSVAIGSGNIHPVIDKIFSFEETRLAYSYMEEGDLFGKIVINVQP